MPTINRVGCSYLIFYLQTRLTVGHGVHLRASTRCAPRLIAQKSGEPPLPTAISAISSHKKAPAAVIRRPSQWLKPVLRLKSDRWPSQWLKPVLRLKSDRRPAPRLKPVLRLKSDRRPAPRLRPISPRPAGRRQQLRRAVQSQRDRRRIMKER